jgi:uncharacterized protein YcbK (DUF882 family)
MSKKNLLGPYFKRSEFECPDGCGFDTIDAEVFKVVVNVREFFGRPVTINSACRCEKHNKEIGGADHSQHLKGRACDIVVQGIEPDVVAEYLEKRYPNQFGIGRYPDSGFTHIDSRKEKARWAM